MKIIVRSVPERKEFLSYILQTIPSALTCIDNEHQAFKNFLTALELSENLPCLHLEDDILFCKDFMQKIAVVIAEHPNEIIQFFSMRKKDRIIGSRYEPGRTFMMNLCFYLPKGIGFPLKEFYNDWDKKTIHSTGYDIFMADFFKRHKLKYWLHVPSLVQHRTCVSVIDPRRSKYRQSITFEG